MGAAGTGRQALEIVLILQRDQHTVEGTEGFTGGDSSSRGPRTGPCPPETEIGEGRVLGRAEGASLELCDAGLQRLDRADSAAAIGSGQGRGRPLAPGRRPQAQVSPGAQGATGNAVTTWLPSCNTTRRVLACSLVPSWPPT